MSGYVSAAMAVVAAATTFISAQNEQAAANRQANYQADVASANAQALRNQADIEKQSGVVKQRQIEADREDASRRFRNAQGKNVASLAASGVEITSGSAMDLLEGNIDLYSQDVGTSHYQQQLNDWETKNKYRQTMWQADVMQSQASFHQGSVVSSGQSLLTSGLKGLGAGMSTYASFGGGFGGGGGAASGAASGAAKGAGKGMTGSASGLASGIKFKW